MIFANGAGYTDNENYVSNMICNNNIQCEFGISPETNVFEVTTAMKEFLAEISLLFVMSLNAK